MATHTHTDFFNHDRMQRPAAMTDEDWDNFELDGYGFTLEEYEDYLAEIDSTLEREWDATDEGIMRYTQGDQLARGVYKLRQRQWRRSVALPLADEVLSHYLNPLQATLYAEEFSARIIAYNDEAPNGIFRDGESTQAMADRVLARSNFVEATKAFMFDKLRGGEAA